MNQAHHRSAAAAIVLALAVSCTPDTRQWSAMSIEELPSPAGPASAEPFVSTEGGDVYLSWLEAAGGGAHDLRFAVLGPEGWGTPKLVERSTRFFVNWADFPSLTPTPDGTLWAHWLERGEAGGYDYAVRLVRSVDGGASWSEPWTPHEDGTPTEHGFVAVLPMSGGGVGLSWLDGRQYVDAPDGTPATREMTLRFRTVGADGTPGPKALLDARVCDCCQTDAAMTDDGPVVVYRDRTEDEIRDIYITRNVGGAWTDGAPVHDDGWEIGGCPVNGPQVSASGREVAVAWFTGAHGEARVKLAFSADAGASFAAPVQVDDGTPIGRVDVLHLAPGRVLVSWLEQTGDETAAVRVREVLSDGVAGPGWTVAETSAARASGFPRMVRTSAADVVLAWTEVHDESERVRVARLRTEEGP